MEDSDGARYDIKLEGNVTRDKVLKIFEMMNLMNIEDEQHQHQEPTNADSVGSKIWGVVDKFFPLGRFTSTNILEKYEDEYNTPIKLSVISTYLARYAAKGRVNRTRNGREWTYQIIKIAQKQQ